MTTLPDTCPRCGLPEHWALKIRARLVLAALALAALAGFLLGAILL